MQKHFSKVVSFTLRWIAPLVVLISAGYFVYAMGARKKPGRKKPPPQKSVAVQVVHPKPHQGTLDISASGIAIPFREVELSVRVSGEVVYKSERLSPGYQVTEGEVLLRIDRADYELEVARLKQEVSRAELDLARLAIDRENATRFLELTSKIVDLRAEEMRRMRKLARTNSASDSEADTVELALLTASQQVTGQENQIRTFDNQQLSLETTLQLARLQLERAELDLARTEIKAPFSGVVLANHVEQNGVVSAGMSIATIEDTSMVEVRCSLRKEDLAFIGGNYELPAIPVTVQYQQAGRTVGWKGVLSRQDGLGIDGSTRTMPVRIRVPDPKTNSFSDRGASAQPIALMRGMFVQVSLHCQTSRPLLSVPESVIRPGKKIWVMRKGRLHIEPVRIAKIESGTAYLDPAGLSFRSDDAIVSSPVPGAKQGLVLSIAGKNSRKGKFPPRATSEMGNRPRDDSAQAAREREDVSPVAGFIASSNGDVKIPAPKTDDP